MNTCFRLALVLLPTMAVTQPLPFHRMELLDRTPGQCYSVAFGGSGEVLAGFGGQLRIWDGITPDQPLPLASLTLPGQVTHMVTRGSWLYAANGIHGVVAVDLADPQQPVITHRLPVDGWVGGLALQDSLLLVSSQVPYALTICDLRDPATPLPLSRIEAGHGNGGVIPHPDSAIAYLLSYWSGMVPVDIQLPEQPDEGDWLQSEYGYLGMGFIGSSALVAKGYHGVISLDLADPLSPVLQDDLPYPDARDIAVQGNLAAVAGGSAGLHLVGGSQPADLEALGSTGLTGGSQPFARSLVLRDSLALVATETGASLVDCRDTHLPVESAVLDRVPRAVGGLAVAGDHLLVLGDGRQLDYYTRDGWPGLERDRSVMLPIPYDRMDAEDGQVAFLSYSGQFQLAHLGEDEELVLDGQLALPEGNDPLLIHLDNDLPRAYAVNRDSRLFILDLSDPQSPGLLRTFFAGCASSSACDSRGDLLALGCQSAVRLLDLSDLQDPQVVSSFPLDGPAGDLKFAGNRLVVLDEGFGIRILDVSNPSVPVELAQFQLDGYGIELLLQDDLLVVTDRYDFSNDASIATRVRVFSGWQQGLFVEEAWWSLDDSEGKLAWWDNHLVVGSGLDGVLLLALESSVEVPDPSGPFLPEDFLVLRAWPNPFNPSTTVSFRLEHSMPVSLELFDLNGRRVRLLHQGPLPGGPHQLRLDAGELASGLYFLSLQAGPRHQVERVLLMK
jgi:hypothetical protein